MPCHSPRVSGSSRYRPAAIGLIAIGRAMEPQPETERYLNYVATSSTCVATFSAPAASAQTYIDQQAGTHLPYVGGLLNNSPTNYQHYGLWEMRMAVDRVPGPARSRSRLGSVGRLRPSFGKSPRNTGCPVRARRDK
jgi:hypothetical protein